MKGHSAFGKWKDISGMVEGIGWVGGRVAKVWGQIVVWVSFHDATGSY